MELIAYNKKRARGLNLRGDTCKKHSLSDAAERGFVWGNVCMSALIANEVTPYPKHTSELLVKIHVEFSLPLSLSLVFTNNWQLKNEYLVQLHF